MKNNDKVKLSAIYSSDTNDDCSRCTFIPLDFNYTHKNITKIQNSSFTVIFCHPL